MKAMATATYAASSRWLHLSGAVRKRHDLYLALGGTLLTGIMSYFAAQATIPAWEYSIFRTINNLPDNFYPVIWIFMQYGVFVTIPIAAMIAAFFKQYRLAVMMLLGGIAIYFGALFLKGIVNRGRPGDLLPDAVLREQFRHLSLGFTSGHTAVAATIATFAHRYLPRGWQIMSLFTLAVVAFGRIYIGGHFPLDVIAGITLGVTFASLINYVFGVPKHFIKSKPASPSLRQLVKVHRSRHPGDIVRLVIGSGVFLAASSLAWTGGITRFEEYLFRLINYLPDFLSPILQLIMQMGALWFVPVAVVIALLLKHPRLAIKAGAGGITVWLAAKLAKELVSRDRPFFLLEEVVQRASNSGILGFPSGHAAVAALIATVSSAYLKKSWSRLIWLAAWLVGFSRIYVGAHMPLDIVAGLALGWIFGSILNLLLGTPDRPLPRLEVLATLKSAGFKIKNLALAHVDARGSSPLFAETADGRQLFVKVVNNEHRNADILFKLWRYFSFREVEDEAPFTSAKHLVEHEAYVSGQALSAGVHVPSVRLASPITSNAAVLVNNRIDGLTLDRYQNKLGPQLLRKIWAEINTLQQARIAHRDLRAANIMIDSKGQPWLIDFSFAETAASRHRLIIDRVELMASLSLFTPHTAVVKAAIDTLGKKAVAQTLPFIQAAILTSDTRRRYKGNRAALDTLRQTVMDLTEARPVPPVRIRRFSYHTLVWLGLSVLLVYFMATQAGNFSDYWNALETVHTAWLAGAIAVSIFTYVMSSVVLLGASRQPLAFGLTMVLESATSFVNRLTPKSIGGITITERYLETAGAGRSEALATVSIIYLAGALVHAFLTALAVIGIARYPITIDMPEGWSLIAIVVGIVMVAGAAMFPRVQLAIKAYVIEGFQGFRRAFTSPAKTLQLIGGSFGVTLTYSLALYFCALAFGISLPFTEILLVYLAGSIVASAAPTPGGLGAAEAALAGGLIALGALTGPAVLAVLVFRVVTFWLPMIPGFFSLRYLDKQHLL